MLPQEVCAVNVAGGYCRCAMYDFSYGQMKATSESVNHPIEYCHKLIGLHPEGWKALQYYLIDIYKWKDKHYKSGSGTILKSNEEKFSEITE